MSAVFTQQMIIAQLGDPDGVLAAQVDAFWQAYSGVPGRSNFLVFLYTKRDAIQILMGSVRTRVTETIGPLTSRDTDLFTNLDKMLADTNAEIARQEKIARASGGALSGVLTTTAPEAPPNVLGPDRNDSRYLGNPYRGRWPR
jgi:hypothetical protein